MKNKPLVLEALCFFVENPYDEIYLREFSRKLSISPNSAQRFLDKFVKEGFVNEIRRGNLRYFRANLDSVTFRQIKVVFSMKQIEDSGFMEYCNELGASHCVLFGSVAKGLDDVKSDVDFVVLGPVKKKILAGIMKFEKKIEKEMQVHVFSWSEWKKQAKSNRAFYQDVITTGIPLIGNVPIVE